MRNAHKVSKETIKYVHDYEKTAFEKAVSTIFVLFFEIFYSMEICLVDSGVFSVFGMVIFNTPSV